MGPLRSVISYIAHLLLPASYHGATEKNDKHQCPNRLWLPTSPSEFFSRVVSLEVAVQRDPANADAYLYLLHNLRDRLPAGVTLLNHYYCDVKLKSLVFRLRSQHSIAQQLQQKLRAKVEGQATDCETSITALLQLLYTCYATRVDLMRCIDQLYTPSELEFVDYEYQQR